MSSKSAAGTTLTTPTRGLGHLLRKEILLTWTDDDGEHQTNLQEAAVIGSASDCAVRLADCTVSRLHAEIAWRPGGPWIRDLGSRNGTRINGVQIEAAAVPDACTVSLGETDLTIRFSASARKVILWPDEHFGALRGRSDAMRELFVRMARTARTDSTVLIVGETGTGKELVAQSIHDASQRAGGPFITVDCTSVPENLFESELFGHARGAFTGATNAREGAIEAASGGTLFLDEIGELPSSMQPKLLRALEQKSVRRVGESKHRGVDVRFVAATHRNLGELVGDGSFREDLYFRLAVILLQVPPLCARREDIPVLLEHFLPRDAEPLGDDVIAWANTQPWRGNVRELRNFVERSIALGTEEAVAQNRPPPRGTQGLPAPDLDKLFKEVRDEWVEHVEREFIRGWLDRTGGNISATAEAIGLNRTYLHKLIKKHDLDR